MNFIKKKEISAIVVRLWPLLNNDICNLISIKYGITSEEIEEIINLLLKKHVIKINKNGDNVWYGEKLWFKKFDNIGSCCEDIIWDEFINSSTLKSFFVQLRNRHENIFKIVRYGFTEMLNNIIDHSKANKALVAITASKAAIKITLIDDGIGIFENIKQVYNFEDMEQLHLELSKGKLTTDPEKHSGEGIFFTSKLFGEFIIRSKGSVYIYSDVAKSQLFENSKEVIYKNGTRIDMIILNEGNDIKMKDIFDKFSSLDDLSFNKTIIEMRKCTPDGDLVSRSQAKRVLVRLDMFETVILDFEGVTELEQGFADELFRVGLKDLTDVTFEIINAAEDIKKMIKRVIRPETANRILFVDAV